MRSRCWAVAGSEDKKPTGPQKLDLEIGNLLPMTGYLDPFGKPSERAADVAAEEIRKAAAKAGARHTVKLQTVDYKSDPNDAVDLGNEAREERRDLPDRAVRLRARRAGGRPASSTPSRVLQITPVGQCRADVRRRGPGLPEPRRAT